MNDKINNKDCSVSFIDPKKIITKLEIGEGMAIADFGCGTGYFSFPASLAVKENGVVYAMDVLPEKLEVVASQAKVQRMANIVTTRVNLECENGSRLPDGSVDWVFLVNMLFMNKDKSVIINEAKRVLKEGGKILLIEWKTERSAIGPGMGVRVAKESLTELVQKNGLVIVQELEISDFHYGMVLAK